MAVGEQAGSPSLLQTLGRKTTATVAIGVVATAASALLTAVGASAVATFISSAIALAALASLVGDGTEHLGERLGAGATGVLQSALGNLPELFIGIFALRDGLVRVVQAALVGSILGNSLLVLGIAFFVGGLRHGTQRFSVQTPQLIATMTMVSVGAVSLPTFAHQLHTQAAIHEEALSTVVAVVLLILFVASVSFIIRGGPMAVPHGDHVSQGPDTLWPAWIAVVILAAAGIGAAFVSDWFVASLTPATNALHVSQGFTGLVIVAIAGNAVENVVGIQFAMRNQMDLATSVILNSSLQVALALIPALVLLSHVIGGAHLTLVMPPLLVVGLALTSLLGTVVVYDGESTWIEGMALITLYVILAASFWWG